MAENPQQQMPDFASDAFAVVRQQLAGLGDEETIINFLRNQWVAATNPAPPQDPQPRNNNNRGNNPGADEPDPGPAGPNDPQAGNQPAMPALLTPPVQPHAAFTHTNQVFSLEVDPDMGPPQEAIRLPLPYAIARMQERQYCPLWYFTKEGLAEAAKAPIVATNASYGVFSSLNQGFNFKAPATVHPSKNVVEDRDLSFEQIMFGKNLFLTMVQAMGWHETAFISYTALYFNLGKHSWRSIPDGDEALIRFHSKRREAWHRELTGKMEGTIAMSKMWDISKIPDRELETCMNEVKGEKAEALLEKFKKIEESLAKANEHKLSRTASQSRSNSYASSSRRRRSASPSEREYIPRKVRATEQRSYTNSQGERPDATAPPSSAVVLPTAQGPNTEDSSTTQPELKYARISTSADAPPKELGTFTSAQDVDPKTTTPRDVVASRRRRALTPYKAEIWQVLLHKSNLISKYPTIVDSLLHGFDVGIPPIINTHTPFNSPSLIHHFEHFTAIIKREFAKHRYIGPFSRVEVEQILGPFQTSPLSLVPKPNKPNSFRLVQNYSFPHNPQGEHSSINSHINAADFPCTWGTFAAFARIILSLPPGSQGAVRDVSEAYRTIPVKPSQWPGMVVRLANDRDEFVIDTQAYFGGTANGGVFGFVADACADIMRAHGLGPISKWVDDHVFFRILRQHLDEYNTARGAWKKSIDANGGKHHNGGRIWYGGRTLTNDEPEEFDEDMVFPIRDLSGESERSASDKLFSCNLEDIDRMSTQLGIPWEKEKDQPWSSSIIFTGFVWDIEKKTVALSEKKRLKYLEAVQKWSSKQTHTLEEVQKLYGKLLHASSVYRPARAYLTNLEKMLGIFHNSPFKPRSPPKHTTADLQWWQELLSTPSVARPLINPDSFTIVNAFSDASSSVGLGIAIDGRWRAWKLVGNWQTDGRDIAWAEAIAFELLLYVLLRPHQGARNLIVFGDNQGVIEAWRNGRSRSWQVNMVFRRIHDFLSGKNCNVHARYIPSESNPADKPSRGLFPPRSNLLPHQFIHPDLAKWVKDYDFESIPSSEFHHTI